MKKRIVHLLRISLTCMMLVSSFSLFAQNKQSIDLKLNQVSFKDFLTAIESKSDYRFVYDGVNINNAPKVSVNYMNTDIIRILENELPRANMKYEVKGFQVILTRKTQQASNTLTVSGQVVDESGEPTPGASVVVKGTTVGALADVDGNYSITLPAGTQNPVLVYSFIGYTNKEEVVNNRSVINQKFDNVTTQLSDVLIVGYGTVRKSDATGAVDIIKSSDFNKGIAVSPEALFNGHIAGVQVTPTNGQPGARTSVRIRGVNSISASSDPLYVIDGVPIENTRSPRSVGNDTGLSTMSLNPLSMVAASDIESMTVLKDASATAIYGSRGANGVIIIKTKSGKDGITSLNFSSSMGISTVSKKLEILSADQYRQFVPNANKDVSTDWQDAIFRTAVVHDHNLTFSNGSKNTSYRASLNALSQDGIVISTGLERYTVRFNVTHKMFNDRLILNLNANNTYYRFSNILEQQTGGADGGIINNALKADPTQPIFNADGSFNEYAKTVRNPVAMAEQVSDKSIGDRFIGSTDATFFFLPEVLSIKTNLGFDADNVTRKAYQPRTSIVARDVEGRALTENNRYSNYLLESYVTFNKTYNKIHAVNAVGGYSWQEFDNYNSSVLAEGFVNDNLGADNIAGARVQMPTNNHERNRLVSFFGRINYNLMDRYLVTATVRRDGSSRFGANNRWATFPSAAVAWKIKEEDFMASAGAVDDLKLRLGYGVTGNQDIGNFRYSTTYGINSLTSGTYFGGVYYPAYTITGIANPNLKWEQTSQWNLGLDYVLFHNRLRGSLDVYSKNTTNLLLSIDAIQPAVSSTYLDNIGAMTNKGIEFSVGGSIFRNRDFEWNSNFNIAYNQNRITELYNNKDIIYGVVSGAGASGNTQILRVGEPIGSFYGRKFLRIEGDKEIFESEDKVITGHALPNYILGFTNSITLKDWDFSVTLRSALGGNVYNNTRAEVSQGSRLPGQNTNMEGALFHQAGGGGIEYMSSRWVEDASFVRLDNMTLGYNFVIAPKVIKSARIYATAQNLFVISKYKGYDPEVNNTSGSNDVNSIGIDYCSYPQARTFLIGFNVNF